MKNNRCNRFDSCNAPVCPLDANYKATKYLRDEPVCYYMMEAMKQNGNAKIRGVMGVLAGKQVQLCIKYIQSTHRPPNFGKLAHKLSLAKHTKSRIIIANI